MDAGIVVEVEADCGGWLKVKCHRKAALKNKVDGKQLVEKEVWGWCLRLSPDGLELLKRSKTSASERPREEEQDDDESGSEPDKIDEYGLAGEGYSGVWYEMEVRCR